MSRERTGTAQYVPPKPGEPQGHYKVRITCNDGSRPWVHLDPGPKSPQAEARAREAAAHYTEEFRKKGIVAVPQRKTKATRLRSDSTGETLADYVKRWMQERERRGLSSVATDRGRLTNHVLPLLGHLPIGDVTDEELRALVSSLDAKVNAKEFSWKTAARCWGLVTKLFADACGSKDNSLRVRKGNPTTGVVGPDRQEQKGKQWLFPSEMTTLAACEAIPLRWRRLYALAAYLYLRPGELAGLEWRDVHSAHGYVHVHQALDLRTGEIKPTKTKHTRKVPIHPSLGPLLAAMLQECGGEGRVVQHDHANKEAEHGFPPIEDLAATFRGHLERAGVTRAELTEDRPTTKRITFYDLRATGITWEVLAGTEHLRVMQRAGHANFTTTQGYIREAEAVGLSVGVPFPPLPSSLVAGHSSRSIVPSGGGGPKVRDTEEKTRRPERDSNATDVPESPGNCSALGGSADSANSAHVNAKSANSGDVGRVETIEKDDSPASRSALGGVVETALAEALQQAAAAAQWSTVEAIAAELKARREARERNGPAGVTSIAPARSKRSGGGR